jgi:hypothetical protein
VAKFSSLRTLRSHGMPPKNLRHVFCSTALTKVVYASCAWYGFANSEDTDRLNAFVLRADTMVWVIQV